MNQGHQCGMLWGATLAVGAEAFRRHEDEEKAIAAAVRATQYVTDSFINRTNTVNCREIIGLDISKVSGLVKFIIRTSLQGIDNNPCYDLAEKWAPEAMASAVKGLNDKPMEIDQNAVSCASEVVRKMGATNEEIVMVSGFAGGLGLSGYGCGALSAAIWMKTLTWCRENPGKTPPFLNNKLVKKILKAFKEETGGEMLCEKISGRKFKTIEEHTEFINNGGCAMLIEMLAKV